MKASSTLTVITVLKGRRRRPERGSGHGVAHGVPAALLVPAAVALALVALPLAGTLARAPWPSLAGADVLGALRFPLVTSALATLACLPLGVPLAWVLARTRMRGERVVRALVTAPVVLPPAAALVAVPLVASPGGGWAGASLRPGTAGFVLAQVFVGLPFVVIGVERALRAGDPRLEETAALLGASRWTVFRRVTLPSAAPGIAAGAVLCWARALGESGAALALAGNPVWGTPIAPPGLSPALGSPAAVALSLALVTVSVAVLAGLRGHWMGTPGGVGVPRAWVGAPGGGTAAGARRGAPGGQAVPDPPARAEAGP
ncbi:ABC transporter permease subunit [Sphaerisporangium album]|uniref:ABC transporter permease subunit n=1 Tax=Sphaerisporangium album TaxID=509200 RepID=A0A367F886_9ACTN|nr:ABC transporter permease subunit [Sphaerisporangium album]